MLAQRRHFVPTDPNIYEERFYVHDRLGSVRLVVDYNDIDATIAVANSYTYTPFGQDIATECTETTENHFKFTGQWHDSEINQYYLRARMYDPTMMRFTSKDQTKGKREYPRSYHKYLYCLNNPVNMFDLNGLWAMYLNFSSHANFGGGGCGQFGIAWDDDGNVDIMVLAGLGGGTPDAGSGISFGWTSADTIYDMEGVGGTMGGSARLPIGPSVGAEYVFGGAGDDMYHGFELNMGLSLALAETHTYITNTVMLNHKLDGSDISDAFVESAMKSKTYGEGRVKLIMAGFFDQF